MRVPLCLGSYPTADVNQVFEKIGDSLTVNQVHLKPNSECLYHLTSVLNARTHSWALRIMVITCLQYGCGERLSKNGASIYRVERYTLLLFLVLFCVPEFEGRNSYFLCSIANISQRSCWLLLSIWSCYKKCSCPPLAVEVFPTGGPRMLGNYGSSILVNEAVPSLPVFVYFWLGLHILRDNKSPAIPLLPQEAKQWFSNLALHLVPTMYQ